MTMPTSRELSYKDRVTYIENQIADHYMLHGEERGNGDLLILRGRITKLANREPSDPAILMILAMYAHRESLNGRALFDEETNDDYLPGDDGYAEFLAEHVESQDQEIRARVQELIKR